MENMIKEDYFKGTETGEFYDFIKMKIRNITDSNIENSLGDYIKKDNIPGLSMKFRAEIAKLP
jgi:hypothetical protein